MLGRCGLRTRTRLWVVAVTLCLVGCRSTPISEDGGSAPDSGPDAGACGANAVDCQGICVDVASSDANCGACGVVCGSGQGCLAGTCVETCAGGSGRVCDGGCVNPQSDQLNCGACGHACPSGNACLAGVCTFTCAPPLVACPADGGETCVDSANDELNCGACGHFCPGGTSCQRGACVPTCAAPLVSCPVDGGASCTDLTESAENCGACGVACKATETCVSGGCVDACKAAGSWRCFGQCVSLGGDDANCGTCGTSCFFPSHCMAGVCRSPVSRCTGTVGLPTPPALPVEGFAGYPIAVGDFDGDGRPDLVAGGDTAAQLFWGEGAFVFDAGTFLPLGSLVEALLPADLDHDGGLDLIVVSQTGGGSTALLTTLLNDGAGNFAASQEMTIDSSGCDATSAGTSCGFVAKDLNGDGWVDVVVGSYRLLVLMNLGNGQLAPPAEYDVFAQAIDVADLNGDGHPDVVFGGNGVGYMLNDGTGALGTPTFLLDGQTAAVADVNGDGLPDIVGAIGELFVWLNTGDAGFGMPLTYTWDVQDTAAQVIPGDFDSDGYGDVVVRFHSAGQVYLYRGGPDGLSAPTVLPAQSENGTGASTVADMDGDGSPDLVLRGGWGPYNVLFVRGDPALGLDDLQVLSPLADLAPVGFSQMAFGDVRADGRADVVFDSPQLAISWNHGGNLGAPQDIVGGSGSVAVGRLGRDGSANIVLLASGAIRVFSNDGGTFEETDVSTSTTPSAPVALVDVDGDGWPDVVFVDGTGSTLRVAFNQQGASFAVADAGYPMPGAISLLAVTDLNGDGCGDVVVASQAASYILEWMGRPSGVLVQGSGFATAGGVDSVAALDVNGDGIPDVLYDDSMGVWVALGGTSTPQNVLATPLYGFAAADLDGDGFPDLYGGNLIASFAAMNDGTGHFVRAGMYQPIIGVGHGPTSGFDGTGRAALLPIVSPYFVQMPTVAPVRCLK